MSHKSVLYFSPIAQSFTDICKIFARQDWVQTQHQDECCNIYGRNLNLALTWVCSIEQAQIELQERYFNNILIDCRHMPKQELDPLEQEHILFDFLNQLSAEKDRERRYAFRRIAVLVGDTDRERVDELIFRLGQKHVGACLRDRSLNLGLKGDKEITARDRLVEQIWKFCAQADANRQTGKKAICAAGGGITGIYYQLGVLKCLDDTLVGLDIRDFDLYFGISTGSLIASYLANNFHIDELIRNIGDINQAWPHKLKIRWRHLNIKEIKRRMGILPRNVSHYVKGIVRGQEELSVTSLMAKYSVLFGPMFDHSELEHILRQHFSSSKHTNDFKRLSRKLYIGATDQDRREHVLFGSDGWDDIPISMAVLASTSIHPFFPSVRIKDRHFTDGAVTKTSNVKTAIQKGADLIFVLDPVVPFIVDKAGFNAEQGNFWVMQQDMKTLAYTRFAQVSEEVLRQNPNVSCYTFVPSNRMRQLMSQNPLAAENFHPIITEAYCSTYRRLVQLEYKIATELKEYGVTLNMDAVSDKVQRIRDCQTPDARVLL